MPGRPSHKVEVSMTNPMRSVPALLSFYDKNENSQEETKNLPGRYLMQQDQLQITQHKVK